MKVILREDIRGQGKAGDIMDVKPGYARNFLIPQGMAYIATDANMKTYEQEKFKKAKLAEQYKLEAEKKKAELEKMSLTAAVKVGEDEKLFGSVTANTIAQLLKDNGEDINHRKILLDEPIKELGVYEVPIDLGYDVVATVKVWVVKE